MHSGYGTKLNYGKDMLYDFHKNEWVDRGKQFISKKASDFAKNTNVIIWLSG
jgi:hypothetical protein